MPRESIKDIIFILEDQDELSTELVENILFLLDISLDSFTSDIKLSMAELLVIRKYFPENYAISIFAHAIRLDPKCSKCILDSFPPIKNYRGFTKEVKNILCHNFSNSFLPILKLIYELSKMNEIATELTDIYQSLIPIIPTLDFSEQAISFEILINFCKINKKYISVLANNDSVGKLYSNIIIDKESLNTAFELLNFISENSEQPLDIIKRLNIESSVEFIVKNICQKAIKIISHVFYNILIDDSEAVNYFLENGFLNLFLSLNSNVSFSIWQDVMEMICIVVYNSDPHQIEYILETSDTIQLISQISESIDNEYNKQQKYIREAISYAFKNLYDVAKFEFEQNTRMILTQEIRNQLEESAETEVGDDYCPVTNFIQLVDQLIHFFVNLIISKNNYYF